MEVEAILNEQRRGVPVSLGKFVRGAGSRVGSNPLVFMQRHFEKTPAQEGIAFGTREEFIDRKEMVGGCRQAARGAAERSARLRQSRSTTIGAWSLRSGTGPASTCQPTTRASVSASANMWSSW